MLQEVNHENQISKISKLTLNDFSNLNNVNRIITSGKRAYDIAICIKNNGVQVDKIEAYLNLDEAVNALYKTKCKKYAISNYTAVQDTRHAIMKFGKK